jgi:hypothetical protein
MDLTVSPKDEIWFLRVCYQISNAVCCFLNEAFLVEINICTAHHDLRSYVLVLVDESSLTSYSNINIGHVVVFEF